MESNIQGSGNSNIDLDSFERVLRREESARAGEIIHGIYEVEVLSEVGRFTELAAFFPLLPLFYVADQQPSSNRGPQMKNGGGGQNRTAYAGLFRAALYR